MGLTLRELVTARHPELGDWLPQLERAAEAYAVRKRAANCMDYDDLLLLWGRLIDEFPEQRAAMGEQFRHILIDEMQDTNLVQVQLVESIAAAAGAGNLTAVGDDAQSIYRFRGANYANILKFPERHPGARTYQLEINYRSTPEIVALVNQSIAHNREGFPKNLVSARPSGARPLVVPAQDVFEEAEFICQEVLQARDEGTSLSRIAVLYRNHYDSIVLQNQLLGVGINYVVRSGLKYFEQAHIKDVLAYLRILVNPRDEMAWRRLLLHLPGIGPAKASALIAHLLAASDPMSALRLAETMALVPTKGKGPFAAFVADLGKVQATRPETHPASAVKAIVQGGYKETLKQKYPDHHANRLADLDQLGVLAARYDSLERMINELVLAGDLYGREASDGNDPDETLVLTTVHQAKGLEWSRVFILRMLDDSFPNSRALDETGGEEEERRIFYVAASRAMDELTLTYPLRISRGGYGPTLLGRISRFVKEIGSDTYEMAVIESEPKSDPGRSRHRSHREH